MLKFCLRLAAPHHPWRWIHDHWSDGVSTIRPFAHPMLEHLAVTDGTSTFVAVRERAAGVLPLAPSGTLAQVDTATYRTMVDQVRTWDLDFLLVEVEPDSAFQVTAGTWSTAPVYLTDAGGRLRGSWSLPDLRDRFSLDTLDDAAVARVLTQQPRYTRKTMFRDVFELTERAHATYGSAGLRMHYPEPALRARPRPVRDGVDIIDSYERYLGDAVYERPFDPRATAVELSGGMDSTNVAATLADRHHARILAYALMIGGDAGEQQTRRRAEMLRHFGFDDMPVDMLALVPLNPDGDRALGDYVHPTAEPYFEAVGAMLRAARRRGARTVFTGDGGDELVSLRGAEWDAVNKIPGRHADNSTPAWLGPRTLAVEDIDDDLAPPSVINEATLLGFALRSPQFLDAGLWPVSPLCQPRLIRFAEQLPVEWRDGKRICRERLARMGMSDDVVHPAKRENMRHVMVHALRTYGMPLLDRLTSDAITVDLGYVDGDALRSAHERMSNGAPIETKLFAVLSLELALRALTRARDVDREVLALCT